jgi:hypothetical protein
MASCLLALVDDGKNDWKDREGSLGREIVESIVVYVE